MSRCLIIVDLESWSCALLSGVARRDASAIAVPGKASDQPQPRSRGVEPYRAISFSSHGAVKRRHYAELHGLLTFCIHIHSDWVRFH
jgi:hypothetical protein